MSFRQTIQAIRQSKSNLNGGGDYSKVVSREINHIVRPTMETFIITEGHGQWGRPLYRTGRLWRLMRNLPAKVNLTNGVWSITFDLNLTGAMEGRVHLPGLGFELLPTELLALLAQHVILSHLTAISSGRKLNLFSRLGLSAANGGGHFSALKPNRPAIQRLANPQGKDRPKRYRGPRKLQ